jgi:hypothetical protein
VLYFCAYANENYVFGSRAFRDAADAHWRALEQLERNVGFGQVGAKDCPERERERESRATRARTCDSRCAVL